MNDGFTFVTAGQCLIKKDLRWVDDIQFQKLTAIIQEADLSFANFENAIRGSTCCWPTKTDFCSAVSPVTLDALKAMGFTALSLANNHAFDMGPGGVLAALKEAQSRDFLYAGTGSDFTEASQPGFRDYPFGRVALVAMHAAGSLEAKTCRALNAREEYGIPARPGVNLIECGISDEAERFFQEEDVQRHLHTIRHAAQTVDFVIAYIHIHIPANQLPEHYRSFARQCIDAGANIVIEHGTPVFQGVEVYRNRPIFFNIANLVFHTYKPEFWHQNHGDLPWESFLAQINFNTNGEMGSMKLHPVSLGNPAQLIQADIAGRCSSYPVLAEPLKGESILQRLAELSKELGTALTIENNVGYWRMEN